MRQAAMRMCSRQAVAVGHSPLFAVDFFSGSCSNYGTYKPPEHPRHGVQVVNPTRVLELEIFLQEGLKMNHM